MGPENANVPKDPLQLSGCPGNDTLRPSDAPHASKRACRNLPNRASQHLISCKGQVFGRPIASSAKAPEVDTYLPDPNHPAIRDDIPNCPDPDRLLRAGNPVPADRLLVDERYPVPSGPAMLLPH